LYVIEDKTRAGNGVVAMSVADLDATRIRMGTPSA
jgi:hypothetical protein